MTLATYPITGSLLDLVGTAGASAKVIFRPESSSGAVIDGSNAHLGGRDLDVPKTGPFAVTITEGWWRILIRPLSQVDGRPAFPAIELRVEITAATTWGALIATITSPIPITLPYLTQVLAGVAEADVSAGLAEGFASDAEDSAALAEAAADTATAPTAGQMATVDDDPASLFRTQSDARHNAAYASKAADNKWAGVQFVPSVVQKSGNKIDLAHDDLHPSARPRTHFFDGNSHPLSAYFANLAAAQVVYPFATALTDETDWAAMQAAILSVTSYPRGWGLLNGQDWRQYGTARLTQPLGTIAMINRPITKAANTNQNFVIGSESSQGARMDYTGGDGGRMFDFDKDSVGTTLDIKNLVLNGAGVRLKGPYRGDLRIGNGILAVDTPHPAIMCEDADKATTQVGVVGLIVENFIAHGCYGAVWQHSSTADITAIRDSRAICNMDTAYSFNGTTDAVMDNCDATGLWDVAAAAGKPYIKISAALDTTNNINLDDVRYGSEAFTAGTGGALKNFTPPKNYLQIGEDTGAQVQLGTIKLRTQAFRTPAVVSGTVADVAIKVYAKCILDVDMCDFGEFNTCLIDEAYRAAGGFYYAGPLQSKWGDKNTKDAGLTQPTFSLGGQNFTTTSRRDPTKIDSRAFADPSDGENLVSTDLSTWSLTNCTLSAATNGGLGDTQFYTVTKTAAGALIFKNVAVVAGRTYHFGITVRKGTMKTMRMRAGIGTDPVPVDTRQVKLDEDFVTYMATVNKVDATGNLTISFYMDNDEETPASPTAGFGTADIGLPFVNEGPVPRPPRTGLRLTTRRAAPDTPRVGRVYYADAVTWDPLARGLGLPYLVLWDGATYQAVSNLDPVSTAAKYFWELNAAGAAAAIVANQSTESPLFTCTNLAATSLVAGVTVFRARVWCNFDNAATSGTFIVRPRVNGTLLQSIQIAPTQTSGATVTGFFLDIDLYVDTTGAGGAVSMGAHGSRISTATGTVAPQMSEAMGVAVNLAGGFQFSLGAIMSTASASNITRALRATVQQIA